MFHNKILKYWLINELIKDETLAFGGLKAFEAH